MTGKVRGCSPGYNAATPYQATATHASLANGGHEPDREMVRMPGVEPGSMASEATTLSIVLHSRRPERMKRRAVGSVKPAVGFGGRR